MGRIKSVIFIFLLIIISSHGTQAQHDSTYYASYTHLITGRAFLSQKYTALTLKNEKTPYTINYIPNAKVNFGIGASYKWATFNIATGIGYLNPDEGQGKTSYLDLQFHKYSQRFTFDLVGQFYKGFYLFPKGTASGSDQYYSRPDLKVTMFGGSLQYIVNNKRFSAQAMYLQNEWQKKSAGTILVGVETYSGRIRGDSTIVPTVIDNTTVESNVDFFEIGVNLGYAYTLVIKEHFFLTGSASASVDYSNTTLKNSDGSSVSSGVSPNTFFRLVTGYNSEHWALQVIYINNNVRLGDGIREAS
ncbi:MAG: DUF4421 family protein [Cyclobacteriaceae bacterium]|nr:DUF4421 family protein [Cyclobacteriaceae bacterium]